MSVLRGFWRASLCWTNVLALVRSRRIANAVRDGTAGAAPTMGERCCILLSNGARRARAGRHAGARTRGPRRREELRSRPGAPRRELHGLSQRGRRPGGRQRRRQEHAREDAGRRAPARQRRDPLRRPARPRQHAPRRARPRNRDRVPGPGARGGDRSGGEHVPRARDPAPRAPGQARVPGQGGDAPAQRRGVQGPRRAYPGHERPGGEHVGRPAPGHRDLPRRDVGEQSGVHGRADGGAWRGADAQRPRADQARPRARAVRGPDQPQHAGGVRGRRPDRGPPSRPACRAPASGRDHDGGHRVGDDRRADVPRGGWAMSQQQTEPDELEQVEAPPDEERQPWWQRLVAGSSTWIGLILIGLILVFSILEPTDFPSVSNARNIATDAAVLLVLGTGLTYVIITAGIDLSVGSVLVFAGVVSAKAMGSGNSTGTIVVGLVVALAAGMAWGVVNGFLIAKAKIPPFIVTLGSFGAALGAALLLTGGVDERAVPTKLITGLGTGRVAGIPWLVIIAAIVCLIFG